MDQLEHSQYCLEMFQRVDLYKIVYLYQLRIHHRQYLHNK